MTKEINLNYKDQVLIIYQDADGNPSGLNISAAQMMKVLSEHVKTLDGVVVGKTRPTDFTLRHPLAQELEYGKNRILCYNSYQGGPLKRFTYMVEPRHLKDFLDLCDIQNKTVYSSVYEKNVTGKVAIIGSYEISSLFFSDGTIYDIQQKGFRIQTVRENKEAAKWILRTYKQL